MHDENENDRTPAANAAASASSAFGKEGYQKFQHAKTQCLYGNKRDKSSVGQWDAGVVELCTLINEKFSAYYTTSSCAGRCFMYTGMGIKQNSQSFVRCRISHTKILDPNRYFQLHTLREDPTGGGDVISPYDGGKQQRQLLRRQQQQLLRRQQQEGTMGEQNTTYHDCDDHDDNDNNEDGDGEEDTNQVPDSLPKDDDDDDHTSSKKVWWIRYEPFILHVACRSLPAAVQFMNLVRPTFKTVGITSLSSSSTMSSSSSSLHHKNSNSGCPKFVVAVYGDEGLDMPLTNEHGVSMIQNHNHSNNNDPREQSGYTPHWLAALVNERHERNANKIARLVQAVRQAASGFGHRDDEDYDIIDQCDHNNDNDIALDDDDDEGQTATTKNTLLIDGQAIRIPRSYDVIGDVAILNSLPPSLGNIFNDNSSMIDKNDDDDDTKDNDTQNIDNERLSLLRKAIGDAIQQRNQIIKVVAVRSSHLIGSERAPGMNGIQMLTGPTDRIQRLPLITTHREYGISCVVNLHQTFFSPRMGQERIRICEQIGINLEEDVLVLFAGVCMDAFLIAARTNAKSVTAVESNDAAFECAQKGHLLLERNKQCQHNNAAQRLQIIHGDCLQVIPTLPLPHYHRILAPRPKEGNVDGDQPPPRSTTTPSTEEASSEIDRLDIGSGGKEFLVALLSVLQPNGGICHWYDFCADHEYPFCTRTVQFLSDICQHEYQYDIKVLHIAHVGSVAKRQLRICVDFRVSPSSKT